MKICFFFILVIFTIPSIAQQRSRTPISDTLYSYSGIRFCDGYTKTIPYSHKKYYNENYYYEIRKIKGRFYVQKEIYHADYGDPQDKGHVHHYKQVPVDNFEPFNHIDSILSIIKNEKIKPFIRYYTDTNGLQQTSELYSSHDCINLTHFVLNEEHVYIELPSLPLTKENIVNIPDQNIYYREQNINYDYNQNLYLVKTFITFKQLVQHLENIKAFIWTD
jgi:hypothetical protein